MVQASFALLAVNNAAYVERSCLNPPRTRLTNSIFLRLYENLFIAVGVVVLLLAILGISRSCPRPLKWNGDFGWMQTPGLLSSVDEWIRRWGHAIHLK